MPGVYNLSIDEAMKEVEEAGRLGLGGLLLFGLPAVKDEEASGAGGRRHRGAGTARPLSLAAKNPR